MKKSVKIIKSLNNAKFFRLLSHLQDGISCNVFCCLKRFIFVSRGFYKKKGSKIQWWGSQATQVDF